MLYSQLKLFIYQYGTFSLSFMLSHMFRTNRFWKQSLFLLCHYAHQTPCSRADALGSVTGKAAPFHWQKALFLWCEKLERNPEASSPPQERQLLNMSRNWFLPLELYSDHCYSLTNLRNKVSVHTREGTLVKIQGSVAVLSAGLFWLPMDFTSCSPSQKLPFLSLRKNSNISKNIFSFQKWMKGELSKFSTKPIVFGGTYPLSLYLSISTEGRMRPVYD